MNAARRAEGQRDDKRRGDSETLPHGLIPKVAEGDVYRPGLDHFISDLIAAVKCDVGDRRDDVRAGDELDEGRFFFCGVAHEHEPQRERAVDRYGAGRRTVESEWKIDAWRIPSVCPPVADVVARDGHF